MNPLIRAAADIGRGLAAARQARPILPGERIHVVGAAGAGASAAAYLAARAGATVTGCDPGAPSPYTPPLEALGISVTPAHDVAHVTADTRAPLVDRLAVTKALTSIAPDHPELAAARALDVPVEPWQQVVADAAATSGARLVAVAGTHGKSSSAGWLAELLVGAGRDPGAFVGALMPAAVTGGFPGTARWGEGPEFVVEADEYAGNFDPYRPSVAVLLNGEWDHPDVFADQDAVLRAFESWIRRAVGGGEPPPTLVVNVGDPGAAAVARRLVDWDGELVAVALADGEAGDNLDLARSCAGMEARFRTARGPARGAAARVVAADVSGTTVEIEAPRLASGTPGAGQEPLMARLALPGRHVAQNALCIAAAALALGVPAAYVVRGLESFRGVGRRLELKGEPRGVAVLDDYAHHPTAIAATLAAVRQHYPGRRVWAVYEPLTFHRTAALLDRFADVLASAADEVVIADIWAGRDPDTTIASAEGLAAAVRDRGLPRAAAPGDVFATADYLAARVVPGDVVLVMGGGHSYRIAERLVELLTSTIAW